MQTHLTPCEKCGTCETRDGDGQCGTCGFYNRPTLEPAKRDRAEKALADVLEMFDDPDQLADNIALATIAGVLAPDAPCRRWSLSNRMLMLRSGTFDARGFKQWKAAGRSVVKGARATYILGPRTIQRTETDPATGEEKKRPVVVGFVAIPVFPYEQTQGADIGYETAFDPEQLPPLADVAARLGVTVTYVPTAATLGQNALGWYQHSTSSIVLGVHDEEVYWHELAHAAHYASGLAKPGTDTARKELVAEVVAAVVAKMYGRPIQRKHHTYLKQYVGAASDVKRAAMAVLHDIEQTLDVIFPRTTGEAAA